MTCRYRIGDVIANLVTMWTAIIVCFVAGTTTEYWGYYVAGAVILVSAIVGSFLNRREREKESVQRTRQQRQLALGVPPDEVGQ